MLITCETQASKKPKMSSTAKTKQLTTNKSETELSLLNAEIKTLKAKSLEQDKQIFKYTQDISNKNAKIVELEGKAKRFSDSPSLQIKGNINK